MSLSNAIALIAVGGTRQADGTTLIDGESYPGFPDEITVEGATFDFSEEEEVDAEIRYWLAHYFRRDDQTR